MNIKEKAIDILKRTIKTACEVAVGCIGTAALVSDVNWSTCISTVALASLTCVLVNVAAKITIKGE